MHKTWQKGMAAAAIAALLLAGCGTSKAPLQGTAETPPSKSGQAVQPGTGGEKTTTPPETSAPKPDPDKKELKIKAYYSDAQLEKLVPKDVTIHIKQDQDKYLAALNQLKKSPDDNTIPLFKGFTYKNVALKDGQLNLDVSIADEGRLGSGGEEMLLDALQKTMFQFSEVKSIEVLVDGKQVESLMGHMDLPHPIKRSQS
ncbi:GerMN domain-containing protein [Paenibacillus ehimensis]|uniref:GerMN domain-containing protein n=1 Tax=Paenibacillus ehimensis TaxID=79264 RepID=UPI00046F324E|nr:GerMN domain-containing protein [Paenibacillus ehimensis]MEC0207690.1 GerMN domain-containing protein [Paenibacillus ehimensis]